MFKCVVVEPDEALQCLLMLSIPNQGLCVVQIFPHVFSMRRQRRHHGEYHCHDAVLHSSLLCTTALLISGGRGGGLARRSEPSAASACSRARSAREQADGNPRRRSRDAQRPANLSIYSISVCEEHRAFLGSVAPEGCYVNLFLLAAGEDIDAICFGACHNNGCAAVMEIGAYHGYFVMTDAGGRFRIALTGILDSCA